MPYIANSLGYLGLSDDCARRSRSLYGRPFYRDDEHRYSKSFGVPRWWRIDSLACRKRSKCRKECCEKSCCDGRGFGGRFEGGCDGRRFENACDICGLRDGCRCKIDRGVGGCCGRGEGRDGFFDDRFAFPTNISEFDVINPPCGCVSGLQVNCETGCKQPFVASACEIERLRGGCCGQKEEFREFRGRGRECCERKVETCCPKNPCPPCDNPVKFVDECEEVVPEVQAPCKEEKCERREFGCERRGFGCEKRVEACCDERPNQCCFKNPCPPCDNEIQFIEPGCGCGSGCGQGQGCCDGGDNAQDFGVVSKMKKMLSQGQSRPKLMKTQYQTPSQSQGPKAKSHGAISFSSTPKLMRPYSTSQDYEVSLPKPKRDSRDKDKKAIRRAVAQLNEAQEPAFAKKLSSLKDEEELDELSRKARRISSLEEEDTSPDSVSLHDVANEVERDQ